ncbi:DUF3054 domain-containing protein [Nocardioides sp. CN2-186]|uniref:DUF3054 domain-containing protein n=1 Tax=Nocardioides tweenelious TaxID=3156607 RepID=UPI0032B4E7BC
MNARRLWPLVADLVCVLALALGGKSSHEPGESDWILLTIAWPFAAAAVLAHLLLARRGRQSLRIWPEGATVVAVTYVLGMLLRALSGRGMAPGFLVVAAIFLVVTMVGWRAVASLVTRRRAGDTD